MIVSRSWWQRPSKLITEEAEAGGLRVQGQLGLILRPDLRNKTKQKNGGCCVGVLRVSGTKFCVHLT
jgi:hypothetical protein